MPAPSSRSCLRVVIVAAVLFVTAIVGVAVWAYREYGPLPVREAPAKHRFPFPDGAETVAYSPDGRRLAAGGKFGIKIWDSAAGQVVWERTQFPSAVRVIRYSPDGDRVLLLDGNGILTRRDAATGESRSTDDALMRDQPAEFVRPVDGITRWWFKSTGVSPDGRWLATGHFRGSYPQATSGEVRVWDTETGAQIRRVETTAGVSAVGVSPDGKLLAVSDGPGGMQLWDVSTGRKVRDLPQGSSLAGVTFSHSGREVVYAGYWCREDNPATVWDVKADAVRPLTGGRQSYAVYVHCMAVSADGRRLALGELVKDHRRREGHRVRVWDLGSGELLADYDFPTEVKALAYSPDGRELAVACGNDVRVCDVP